MINKKYFKVTFPEWREQTYTCLCPTLDRAKLAATGKPGIPGDRQIDVVDVQVFEAGEHIEVELHRGGWENEAGISRGGAWITVRGVIEAVNSDEHVFFRSTDGKHGQVMSGIAGEVGFPFRNARAI